MLISENYNLILEAKGDFIRFGGEGIIDGLKSTPTKNECFEIIRHEPGSKEQVTGLILRRFGCRNFCLLPFYCFKQDFEIIPKKQFKQLPKY